MPAALEDVYGSRFHSSSWDGFSPPYPQTETNVQSILNPSFHSPNEQMGEDEEEKKISSLSNGKKTEQPHEKMTKQCVNQETPSPPPPSLPTNEATRPPFNTTFINQRVQPSRDTMQTEVTHRCGERVYHLLQCPSCCQLYEDQQRRRFQRGGSAKPKQELSPQTIMHGALLGLATILFLEFVQR